MSVQTLVSGGDKVFIEPTLITARFVASHEQNCLPLWIKSERYAPDPTASIEEQLLHVGMFRAIERVGERATKTGAVFPLAT